MSTPLDTLRANPGLVVAVALPVGLGVVLTLVGLLLRAAGASIRPVLLIGLLALPLVVAFLVAGLVRARVPTPSPAGAVPGLEVTDGRFADSERLFAPDVDPRLIHDARRVFPEVVGDAECAELAILGTGETALVAQFASAEAAREAAARYWKVFQVTGSAGDETKGWRGTRRLNSDRFELHVQGRVLRAWTALTAEACALRRQAAGDLPGVPTGAGPGPAGPGRPLFPALQSLEALFRLPLVRLAGTALLIGIYVATFFRGATWAGTLPPRPGASPVPAQQLGQRLLALNEAGTPLRIEPGASPDEYVAVWNPTDLRWIDHARVHAVRRTFRVRLVLDPATGSVRPTDEFSEFDASAGADGARIGWKAGRGIVFFQEDSRTVLGFRWDAAGRLEPDPAHAFRFSLRELKSPLIATVTASGWAWRPAVWTGPRWLRWLTG